MNDIYTLRQQFDTGCTQSFIWRILVLLQQPDNSCCSSVIAPLFSQLYQIALAQSFHEAIYNNTAKLHQRRVAIYHTVNTSQMRIPYE